MSYNFPIFFFQIFCFVAIVGISLVRSDPIDAEILNVIGGLDASQMNKAEADRVAKTFGNLFAKFGNGGKEETTTAPTTTTTTTARTTIKKQNGEMDTLKIVEGVLAAIKSILLLINPSEDQPLVFLVNLLEQGLKNYGQHMI